MTEADDFASGTLRETAKGRPAETKRSGVPSLPEKVVSVDRALSEAGVEHAIGGAMALVNAEVAALEHDGEVRLAWGRNDVHVFSLNVIPDSIACTSASLPAGPRAALP